MNAPRSRSNHELAPRGAWHCQVLEPDAASEAAGNGLVCVRCGSDIEHPIDVCAGVGCGHLVVFHGGDTEGCGRISAAGWCACRRTFAREHADFVRYA